MYIMFSHIHHVYIYATVSNYYHVMGRRVKKVQAAIWLACYV